MKRELITVEEADRLLKQFCRPLGTQSLPIESAVQHVLAEAVQARKDYPPWTNSAMDGFGVRTRDLTGDPPYELPLVQSIMAGDYFEEHLPPGKAVRIMTGAPVPDGVDAVVPQEWTEWDDQKVIIHRLVNPGANIRHSGEDFKERAVLLHAGQYLTPAHIALIASAGWREVEVFRKPRVSIITTGDELVEPGQMLSPGKLWESNSFYLMTRLKSLGIPVKHIARAKDRPDILEHQLREALMDADAVITCGGVSVGDRDYIPSIWSRMGGEVIFHGVAVKPGKPILFGHMNGKYLFGLPGNPASTFVTFERFVLPWLMGVQGLDHDLPLRITAGIQHHLANRSNRVWYLRARLIFEGDRWVVLPLAPQGSHIVTTTAEATALIELPPESEAQMGQSVMVIPLHWEPYIWLAGTRGTED